MRAEAEAENFRRREATEALDHRRGAIVAQGCACFHAAVHMASEALTYRGDDPARGVFDPVLPNETAHTTRRSRLRPVPIQPRRDRRPPPNFRVSSMRATALQGGR
jgi:hypothetical protein